MTGVSESSQQSSNLKDEGHAKWTKYSKDLALMPVYIANRSIFI
ncbi:hypothetical protein ACK3F5_00865 [Photorhabdus asymbiotica UENP]